MSRDIIARAANAFALPSHLAQGDGDQATLGAHKALEFLQQCRTHECAGHGRELPRFEDFCNPEIVLLEAMIMRHRHGSLRRHEVCAHGVDLGLGRVVGIATDVADNVRCMGQEHAKRVVAIPDLQDAAGLQDADVLVEDGLLEHARIRRDQAHILGHDQVELIVAKGERDIAHIVLHKAPVHVVVGIEIGCQRGHVEARKGDGVAATIGEMPVTHDAPESRSASDLEHALGRFGVEDGRADRAVEDLAEHHGAQRLAMQLCQVARQWIVQGRVAQVSAAVTSRKVLAMRVRGVAAGHRGDGGRARHAREAIRTRRAVAMPRAASIHLCARRLVSSGHIGLFRDLIAMRRL